MKFVFKFDEHCIEVLLKNLMKLTSRSVHISNIFKVKYAGNCEGKDDKGDFHVTSVGFRTRLG